MRDGVPICNAIAEFLRQKGSKVSSTSEQMVLAEAGSKCMSDDVVISVENVSMNYNIYRRPAICSRRCFSEAFATTHSGRFATSRCRCVRNSGSGSSVPMALEKARFCRSSPATSRRRAGLARSMAASLHCSALVPRVERRRNRHREHQVQSAAPGNQPGGDSGRCRGHYRLHRTRSVHLPNRSRPTAAA